MVLPALWTTVYKQGGLQWLMTLIGKNVYEMRAEVKSTA
jgi:hypothetical protein